MKEAKVKSYTRKTKSGKTVQVRAHSRKCEGGSCADKKGAGIEITRYKDGFAAGGTKEQWNNFLKKKRKKRTPYPELDPE